jgi:hypothetical protein
MHGFSQKERRKGSKIIFSDKICFEKFPDAKKGMNYRYLNKKCNFASLEAKTTHSIRLQ